MNENQVKTILRIDSSSSHSHSVTRRLGDELIRRLSLANEGANLLVRDLSGGIRFLSESWVQASLTSPAKRTLEQQDVLAVSDQLVCGLSMRKEPMPMVQPVKALHLMCWNNGCR